MMLRPAGAPALFVKPGFTHPLHYRAIPSPYFTNCRHFDFVLNILQTLPSPSWFGLQTSGIADAATVVTSHHQSLHTPVQRPHLGPSMAALEERKLAGMVLASTKHPASIGRIMSFSRGLKDMENPEEVIYTNPHEEDVGRIERVDWAQELLAEKDMHIVLACAAMGKPEPGVDPDHLFLGLLRQDIIRDVMFLFNPTTGHFHTLIAMGPDVCGHPCTVHGGFTSAVIDETTGGLVFSLKKNNLLGPGPAFTVRLEVDYRKPIPAGSNIICTAKVDSVEGRKAWISAEVMDRPGGVVYASGRALYVTPRQYVEAAAANGAMQGEAAAANGTKE